MVENGGDRRGRGETREHRGTKVRATTKSSVVGKAGRKDGSRGNKRVRHPGAGKGRGGAVVAGRRRKRASRKGEIKAHRA